jgi:hypothetical protein
MVLLMRLLRISGYGYRIMTDAGSLLVRKTLQVPDFHMTRQQVLGLMKALSDSTIPTLSGDGGY